MASACQRLPGVAPGLDSAILELPPAQCAWAGYRGLVANKRVVLLGLGITTIPLRLRLFPRGFVAGVVARMQLSRT